MQLARAYRSLPRPSSTPKPSYPLNGFDELLNWWTYQCNNWRTSWQCMRVPSCDGTVTFAQRNAYRANLCRITVPKKLATAPTKNNNFVSEKKFILFSHALLHGQSCKFPLLEFSLFYLNFQQFSSATLVAPKRQPILRRMDSARFELAASSLQTRRSTGWAKSPREKPRRLIFFHKQTKKNLFAW